MPRLVVVGHLLQDRLDIFIGRFNCPIHLRTVRRGMPVSDLELLTEFCHHVVVEISGIIRDDGFWETESA